MKNKTAIGVVCTVAMMKAGAKLYRPCFRQHGQLVITDPNNPKVGDIIKAGVSSYERIK